MVWTGVLRAVLLLFLLSSGIWDVEGQETVDLKALELIVRLINLHSSRSASASPPRSASARASGAASRSASLPASGSAQADVQYAMAVRIAKNQCLQNFNVRNFRSLKQEVADFKNKLSRNAVHEGNVMVAASYRNKKHSEYRLLMEGGGKVINKLLETTGSRNEEDCVIFYTYNSPCLKTCLNEEKDKEAKRIDADRKEKGRKPLGTYRCIYPTLDIFNKVRGPKAFVFTQIYREDMNSPTLPGCLRKVTEKLPLYQCNPRCRRCDQGNSYCTGTNLPG